MLTLDHAFIYVFLVSSLILLNSPNPSSQSAPWSWPSPLHHCGPPWTLNSHQCLLSVTYASHDYFISLYIRIHSGWAPAKSHSMHSKMEIQKKNKTKSLPQGADWLSELLYTVTLFFTLKCWFFSASSNSLQITNSSWVLCISRMMMLQ